MPYYLKISLTIIIFGGTGSCAVHGLSPVVAGGAALCCGLWASRCADRSCCGTWALGHVGFGACGAQA